MPAMLIVMKNDGVNAGSDLTFLSGHVVTLLDSDATIDVNLHQDAGYFYNVLITDAEKEELLSYREQEISGVSVVSMRRLTINPSAVAAQASAGPVVWDVATLIANTVAA